MQDEVKSELVVPATGARDSVAPIEPGTQRIEASVSVTFAVG